MYYFNVGLLAGGCFLGLAGYSEGVIIRVVRVLTWVVIRVIRVVHKGYECYLLEKIIINWKKS